MKHWMAVHTFVDGDAKFSYHKYMADVENKKFLMVVRLLN